MRSKHKRGRKDHSAIRSLQDYGESDKKVREKEKTLPTPTAILVSFFKVKSKWDLFNAIFKTSGRFQKHPFHEDVLEAVVTLLQDPIKGGLDTLQMRLGTFRVEW